MTTETRVIEFYAIRKTRQSRESVPPEAAELEIPLERLSLAARNVAWVLKSTIRGRGPREGGDRLEVASVLSNRELAEREARVWPVYKILNDGCEWLYCGTAEIQRFLTTPEAEPELRERYLNRKIREFEAYGISNARPLTDWLLPPLYLEPEATYEEDVARALAYLETLAEQIRCAGGDMNNIEGAHRRIINGERFLVTEESEAELERINRAVFGGRV